MGVLLTDVWKNTWNSFLAKSAFFSIPYKALRECLRSTFATCFPQKDLFQVPLQSFPNCSQLYAAGLYSRRFHGGWQETERVQFELDWQRKVSREDSLISLVSTFKASLSLLLPVMLAKSDVSCSPNISAPPSLPLKYEEMMLMTSKRRSSRHQRHSVSQRQSVVSATQSTASVTLVSTFPPSFCTIFQYLNLSWSSVSTAVTYTRLFA